MVQACPIEFNRLKPILREALKLQPRNRSTAADVFTQFNLIWPRRYGGVGTVEADCTCVGSSCTPATDLSKLRKQRRQICAFFPKKLAFVSSFLFSFPRHMNLSFYDCRASNVDGFHFIVSHTQSLNILRRIKVAEAWLQPINFYSKKFNRSQTHEYVSYGDDLRSQFGKTKRALLLCANFK